VASIFFGGWVLGRGMPSYDRQLWPTPHSCCSTNRIAVRHLDAIDESPSLAAMAVA
jgi:hypothetical protein